MKEYILSLIESDLQAKENMIKLNKINIQLSNNDNYKSNMVITNILIQKSIKDINNYKNFIIQHF
jgi:hypothetical protein